MDDNKKTNNINKNDDKKEIIVKNMKNKQI